MVEVLPPQHRCITLASCHGSVHRKKVTANESFLGLLVHERLCPPRVVGAEKTVVVSPFHAVS